MSYFRVSVVILFDLVDDDLELSRVIFLRDVFQHQLQVLAFSERRTD